MWEIIEKWIFSNLSDEMQKLISVPNTLQNVRETSYDDYKHSNEDS